MNGEGEDKVIWLETKSGTFSIKSLYSILERGRLVPFPLGVVWNAWVPPKASFFFFYLGGTLGKSSNSRPVLEGRLDAG